MFAFSSFILNQFFFVRSHQFRTNCLMDCQSCYLHISRIHYVHVYAIESTDSKFISVRRRRRHFFLCFAFAFTATLLEWQCLLPAIATITNNEQGKIENAECAVRLKMTFCTNSLLQVSQLNENSGHFGNDDDDDVGSRCTHTHCADRAECCRFFKNLASARMNMKIQSKVFFLSIGHPPSTARICDDAPKQTNEYFGRNEQWELSRRCIE